MTILTVGTIVRSFASLLMADAMTPRVKQISVIIMAIILYVGYTLTHEPFSISSIFDTMLDGLTAGLTALGVYHVSVDNQPVQTTQEG